MSARDLTTVRGAWILMAFAALTLFGPRVRAQVISGSQISWLATTAHGGNYSAVVLQNISGDATQIWFNYTGTTLQPVATDLDEGSDWYLANAGDFFCSDTISADRFPVILKAIDTSPFFLTETVDIPLGNFYLGVNTGTQNNPPNNERGVFGWLELDNTGTQLISLGNSVAYGYQGIIVGTTTPIVPEPSAAALLLAAAPLLVLRPRRAQFSAAPRYRRRPLA